MHEGDTYFERCYAADFDARIAPQQKELCWQAWIAHYTKHQPAHRVDYALRRVEALQSGEPLPALPGLGAAAGSPEMAGFDASLLAANAVLTSSPGVVVEDAGPVPNGCEAACSAYEAHCRSACPEGDVDCRSGCARERAICSGGCY